MIEQTLADRDHVWRIIDAQPDERSLGIRLGALGGHAGLDRDPVRVREGIHFPAVVADREPVLMVAQLPREARQAISADREKWPGIWRRPARCRRFGDGRAVQ